MFEIVDKSTRFRQVCQFLSLIVGTPVNKPNSRKADNFKHSLWEANVITGIILSQDSIDINIIMIIIIIYSFIVRFLTC